MKRTGALIVLCCMLLCSICGCATPDASESALAYIDLCDYRSLHVPEDEYTVSDNDLATAIRLQMDALDLEAPDLSDSIAAEYFNCNSAVAAMEMVKTEIVENRFYEAARDMIFESSKVVEFPESSKEYVERMVAMQRSFAKAEGMTLSDYLNSAYEMTEEEFQNATLFGYADIMILRAIAEKEHYTISAEDRNDLVESTAENIGLTLEETLDAYGEEYFDCLLYEEFLKELLLTHYSDTILSAVQG